MFAITRWSLLIAMIVLSGILAGITAGIAQSPSTDPEPPELKMFREALEGKGPVGETGNGIMDDLLDIAGQRKSVLHGSSLDPSVVGKPDSANSGESQRALAAELLLRTSRTLEQIGPADRSRQELVKKMRGEAGRLLSE